MDKISNVLNFLESLSIPYTLFRHPSLPTIDIAMEYWKEITGTHCKNIFLRNHKGDKHYLVIFECHHELNIHDLEKRLREGKLSFASPQRLEANLGLSPGSVSPFGLVNDTEHKVKVFIDINLLASEYLSFHPNDNTATLLIKTDDFKNFLKICKNECHFQELY
ncbi:MAG: prolyl-tRNA editing protein [Bacteroidetes bacterium GWF2_40_14]|nr:MAG: prolyl-tRNA editing protein [Bacteroidetes bacterium GWF2_40_14]